MGVFHAYDVRGLCPPDITEDLARHLGNALALMLDKSGRPGALGIARDMRPSSPGLADALAAGIQAAGRDVVDLGMTTTPCFYYAIGALKLAGGIIVTASHNPAEYNGFKICREEAIPIGGNSGLKDLEAAVLAGQFHSVKTSGKRRSEDVQEAYLSHLLAVTGGSIVPLRIAIDCGNGVAGPLVERFLKRLPQLQSQNLFFEPDGTFPNHEANPLKHETLDTLRERVRSEKLDLGIAFDGDGDRAAFVDEKGDIVANDLLTALLAEEMLKKHPGKAIVYDLRSSMVVRETIEKLGGKALEERVGHAFIKKTMRENDAVFGGELSGHYYWKDNSYADSALLAVARTLMIRSRENKPLSELIKPFRRTFQSGERNFTVADKDGRIKALMARYSDGEQSQLDGITVRYKDWWFNVRKSNTEPVLRLNLEARSQALHDEKLTEVQALIGA
jgi:phosphomannomutase